MTRRPDDHVIVLHGATGDLARRTLLPGLFGLFRASLLPERFRIVGTSPARLGDDGFRAVAREAIEASGARSPNGAWEPFARSLRHVDADEEAPALEVAVERAEEEVGRGARRLHHLAVPAAAGPGVVRAIARARLAERARVVLEKPFGTDLASARELNRAVHQVSTSRRCSGSTTSSPGPPSRTSSPAGSPTASSRPAGTASTSRR